MSRSNPRPTLKDVAEAAGVSFKTVSRVVNDEPGVSEAMANRVKAAISELDYQPDDRARTLRSREVVPATIGFIHADIANPFFTSVHRGLEEVASAHDCLILVGSSDEDPEREIDLVRAFAGRRVDGLVIVPVGDVDAEPDPNAVIRTEIDRGTAVVFIDREPGIPGDLVLSDHAGGARLAAEHLIAGGHTKIAFLGDHRYLYSAAERRRGFREALEAVGLKPFQMISDVASVHAAEEAVRSLMSGSDRPTALFTAQNYLTNGAVKALHSMNLHRRVALVGFDDIDMADVIEPGVTVVPQDAAELGRQAGELLFSRLAGLHTSPVRKELPLSLVTRGSGEIAAVDNS